MRRKIFMVLALVALLVVMSASAALAARLGERPGNDNINAGGGRDVIKADRYRGDRDVVNGGSGNDVIHVDDGDRSDRAIGGPGNDRCYADSLVEVAGRSCESVNVQGHGNPNRELREIRRFI